MGNPNLLDYMAVLNNYIGDALNSPNWAPNVASTQKFWYGQVTQWQAVRLHVNASGAIAIDLYDYTYTTTHGADGVAANCYQGENTVYP